jgi:XTP/dITP diphosphohydrolase
MSVLVVGTHNAKKREEMVQILSDLGVEVRDLSAFPGAPEVDETGTTFEENARKKASELAARLKHWVVADDSGLVVPALGGAPGVYSARYSGEPRDDERNNDKLLHELRDVPDEKRGAYYVCVVALADPTGTVKGVVDGQCHGVIVRERRGSGGFGYDPLFLIPEFHRTFGELGSVVKHALSHRGRALEKLPELLRRALTGGPQSPSS